MILLSMGLPGRFARWCEAVMAKLAGQLGGEVASLTWPPLPEMLSYEAAVPVLEQLGRGLIADRGEHLVVGVRQPDHGLRRILAEAGTPFVLALEDPREAVGDVIAEAGGSAGAAVRALANSCALLMLYDGLPGVCTLRSDIVKADPTATVAAIADHFGIAIEAEQVAAIAEELDFSSGSNGGEVTDPTAWAADKMVDGALGAYHRYFFDGRFGEVTWNRGLFLFHDGNGPSAPINVAGGSPILVFGPYIHLPAGSWTARVVLGFSPEAVGHTFLVDVCVNVDAQVASSRFSPDRPGAYQVDLSFALGEPSGRGIEIRVWVIGDQAQGQMAFGHVVLQAAGMHKDAGSPDGDNFLDVLTI